MRGSVFDDVHYGFGFNLEERRYLNCYHCCPGKKRSVKLRQPARIIYERDRK